MAIGCLNGYDAMATHVFNDYSSTHKSEGIFDQSNFNSEGVTYACANFEFGIVCIPEPFSNVEPARVAFARTSCGKGIGV